MKTKSFIGTLSAALIALAIGSCGGGGGGGGGSTTIGGGGGGGGGGGATSITSANALTYAAYVGYLAGVMDIADSGAGIITAVASENPRQNVKLGQLINSQLDTVLGISGQIMPGNIVGVILPLPAMNCSGSGSITVEWDDKDNSGITAFTSGDTAVLTFNDCVETALGSDKINGSMAVSAVTVTGDLSVPASAWTVMATVTLNSLSLTWSTGNETINGTLDLNKSTPDGLTFVSHYTGSINGSGTDDGSSYTYSYTNMDLNGTYDDNTQAYNGNFKGTITDSDIGGTINVETLQKFEGIDPNDPDKGVAKVTATDNSNVTMTVVDSINVRLDVDTNGDGTTDDTVNTTWSVLNSI